MTVSIATQFDEEVASIGEFVTRDQFFGRAQRINTPESRLLLQVLMLALDDAQLAGTPASSRSEEMARQANDWIASDDTGLMSCRMICETLEIDIGTLRRRLLCARRVRSRHAVI